jgi:pyrroline-5-carboxylate reductase
MIYFDSAATTLQKPPSVSNAVAEAIHTMTTPGRGDHSAARLAEQTMLGTAAYLRQSGADLGEFIAGVATKGGTTAAGMEVMRASEFKNIVASTLAAAAARSAELGR